MLSFVVGYMVSKCGYNLNEGIVNPGSCSANEPLITFIGTTWYNNNAWRKECKEHKTKSKCTNSILPDYIPNNVKIDPHKCIWKQN